MKLNFWGSHGMEEFAEAIRPELKALPVPQARPELLNRILASRAAGTRIILPDATPEKRSSRGRYVTVAAIAAALLLIVIPREPAVEAPTDESFASPLYIGRAAFAQQPRMPVFPPIVFGRTNNIAPMTLEFARRTLGAGGKVVSEINTTLALTSETLNGISAWRIISADRATGSASAAPEGAQVESIYVARNDLRMLSRSVHIGPYKRFERVSLQQRFDADRITGRMTTAGPSIGEGHAIDRRLTGQFGPYLSDALTSFFLMGTPLHREWRGSASLLGWGVLSNDLFTPIEMQVLGEEKLSTPGGTFDTWRVSVRLGEKQMLFWARKSDGLGVRVYDDSQSTAREVVLVSAR